MATASASNKIALLNTFWGRYSLDGGGTHRDEDYEVAQETAEGRSYGRHDKRVRRYRLFWSLYSNTLFQRASRWAESVKESRDLYGFVRNLQSPAYRLGEFWASHLMGGPLDPKAGDGKDAPSALPIVTENDAIREAIALLWEVSNWQANKEVYTSYGAILGDTALAVVDDPAREQVYLRVVHPAMLAHVDRDVFGNVKGYIIVERRDDPEWEPSQGGTPNEVLYREYCQRDESDPEIVHYLTTKGESNEPYDWRDYPAGTPDSARVGGEWIERYGFVPLVVVNHRDRGAGWGWSEYLPSLSRFYEVDNLASILADQIAKVVQSPQLLTGITADEVEAFGAARERLDWPFLHTENVQAGAMPLAGNLDIAGAAAYIASMVADIERMHPELRADEAGADASGVSRRIARERIEATVIQRRAGYDAGLVRAHQMALSIGAMRRYKGFEKFPAMGGFEKGLFDHSIGPRPVFALAAAERLEEATARGTVIKTFLDAGFPLREALIEAGYTAAQADEIAAAKATDDAAQVERQRQIQAMGFDDERGDGDGDEVLVGAGNEREGDAR